MKPTTVYVPHAWWLVFAGGLFTVVAAGFGAAFVAGATGPAMVVFGIGFFGAAVWAGRGTFRLIQHADSGLPLFRLGEDGLECAYGRVRWVDVLTVSSEDVGHGTVILFVLRPGTAWEPVEDRYSTYEVERIERRGLEILRVAPWMSYRQTMQIVNSYRLHGNDVT